MPALDVAGAALHYDRTGNGPPLVLVHGSAVDGTTWDGVMPDLARDYRVITYHRRGYGRSVHKPVRDHRLHARDLAAVLEQVTGEPAVVVGWSAGGNAYDRRTSPATVVLPPSARAPADVGLRR